MFTLTYVSSAVRPFRAPDLDALLVQARAKNERLGITGMLLYEGGNFMQVLEGEEAVVRELFATIRADPRHRGVIELHAGPGERQFSDWSMGFRDLNDRSAKHPRGYSEFMNTPLTDRTYRESPGRAMRLLTLFKQNMELRL